MAEAQIKPEDKAREENVLIFKALNKLKRHGLCTNNSAGQTNNSAEQTKKNKQTSWKRTWGSLVTQYGKREEARLHVAIRPFTHTQCTGAARQAELLQRLTRSLQRVGVFPVEGCTDVFEVVGAQDSDGTKRIQVFMDDNGIQEYLLLS